VKLIWKKKKKNILNPRFTQTEKVKKRSKSKSVTLQNTQIRAEDKGTLKYIYCFYKYLCRLAATIIQTHHT